MDSLLKDLLDGYTSVLLSHESLLARVALGPVESISVFEESWDKVVEKQLEVRAYMYKKFCEKHQG